jgi:ethanolamine ammonia-lyase large subunit
VQAAHTISVSYTAIAYTVTASSGANGSISPVGPTTVYGGTTQTFSLTPDAGYHVADVLVDGVSVGAVTSYAFSNITGDHTIAASFAINSYTITASVTSGSGTISPAGVTTLDYNTGQTYAIAANTGSHITDVLVDNVELAP